MKSTQTLLYGLILLNRENKPVIKLFNQKHVKKYKDKLEKIVNSSQFKSTELMKQERAGIQTFTEDTFRIILTEAGNESILALIGDVDTNPTMLFSYAYLIAEKVIRFLEGKLISLVVPNLENLPQSEITSPELVNLSIKQGEFIMKVILGGDSRVGKTTIVEQFVHDKMRQDYKSTIGVNIMSKHMHYPHWNIDVKFSIYDLGGQTQFKDVRKMYVQGARAGFLVYDVTRPETFQNISRWFSEVRQVEPESLLILVGNKVDLKNQRKITHEQGKELARKLQIRYIETTALNKDFIDEAFKTMGFFFILQNRAVQWNKT